jgi:hypothetical protein
MTQSVYFEPWQSTDDVEVVINHDNPMDITQAVTIVKVTNEGVIIDFYLDGEPTGTIGMTYDEWFVMATSATK